MGRGVFGRLDPSLARAQAQIVAVGQPDPRTVVGRLAQDPGDGVELPAAPGQRHKSLVEAQGVEFERVVAENPDAVEVALGDVLEPAGLEPDPRKQLIAVEGPLAQTLGLEAISDLLDRGRGLGEGLAGALGLEPIETQAIVDANQSLLVGPLA